ncbi:uncharacterized protein KD926_008241 [Aspergillus affinis]|uniref:uncharacterized protein n=1 Tax=Aspergillus affinis TaxID=1070780 RepID=UPI0022FEA338|nr:uncharacterized protein KD926_008241 [Aspergillus affinis]KAI9040418.1 hypothetical protein KD926_008241 [Aspergillus affinis]
MTMTSNKLQIIEERCRLAASRGFTIDFQQQQESQENVICHKKLAPTTYEKYDRALGNWELWRLSRNESKEKNFSHDEPDPTPQILKSFAEDYIATRKKIPSQKSACHNLTSFTSLWERETSRTLPLHVKKDVLNYIRNTLTPKYGLRTEPRERALVTAKDIEYLLRRLFGKDSHDYKHERARVQTGSSLSLFAGSGARAGAIVESSSYRDSNECLYYKHLSFNIKWSENGHIKRWVTIDPEFLKGWRYRDDVKMPKNWFREHPVLGFNFVFWVIVHGIADSAFRGISSVDDLLTKRPPVGRESWTLQWSDAAKELPFFRMITPKGPSPDRALTFSAMRHSNTALAEREGFKDTLRIHGIRGEVANRIDPKASEATRGQALDHQNHDTYLKYQAQLKSLDVQAMFYNMEPDYECRDMEQSMAHHRDPNAPQHIDAAALAEFESDDEILALNKQIAALTKQIAGRPTVHRDLDLERRRLYSRKAKKLEAKRSAFIAQWWEASYDEYIAGNDFSERDTTCLFDIYKKYMPARSPFLYSVAQNTSCSVDESTWMLRPTNNVIRMANALIAVPSAHLCSSVISVLNWFMTQMNGTGTVNTI